MNQHQQEWTTVGLDIWQGIKYILPPVLWTLFGYRFGIPNDHLEPDFIFIFLFIVAVLISYWSYQ
jgi:hypothetical protein